MERVKNSKYLKRNYMIKPASKIKLIIRLTTISKLELRMEDRLRGTLMDLRELIKITRFACKEGQSKRRW